MITNIGNSIDPFYRYTRPIAIVINKTKSTVITNIENIAKALHTESKYILYYTKVVKSTSIAANGEIKMVLSKSQIEDIINNYIDEYILCKNCTS